MGHHNTLKNFFLILLTLLVVASITLRIRYGGGEPYPDLTTTALLDESQLEEFLSYPEPIGNVAVSSDGRVFFTVHPESRPQGNRLLEWVDGAAIPYPNGTVQPHLLGTVLGIVVDRDDRLWTIDNGNHGFGTARLLAFDLNTGKLVHDHEFAADIAPAGSFLQDLQVSSNGEIVVIADASFWRKTPAIIVYDTKTRSARRVLESHSSVSAQNYLIRNTLKDMSYLGGLVSLKGGVDGIAFDTSNEWLYYAAISQSSLYRIPVRDLLDQTLPAKQLANRVERVSEKPLSDGLSTDLDGNVYVTDIEHGAVFMVNNEGQLTTLIRSPRIRWADALSFGPDGWLYLADSAIPDQVMQSRDHIDNRGPYSIYRFKPGHYGVPGQ
jgi:sugar lactone lactonase YvrE